MTSSLLRSSRALALVAACALVLSGCSLFADDSSRTGKFESRDLDGFFDDDGVPSDITLDFTFSTIRGNARIAEVEGLWDDSKAGGDACFDSYAASLLVSDDGAGDEFVYIAVNDSTDPSSYVSIDGRVFADTASAAGFFSVVHDAAATCTADGGYELVANGEQVWGADAVSVSDADELDLPDGVRAIYQEEHVDDEFAEGFRVYMLQRDNLIVSITVQPGLDGDIDFDDGEALVEAVAAALGRLR